MKRLLLMSILMMSGYVYSQQVADTTYHPDFQHPAYETGKGPVVFIDEGHHNFHTKNGRYKPFASLLERDGYRVKGYNRQYESNSLSQGNILVIANALHQSNVNDWFLPTPSAFTASEIEVIRQWVSAGGSLFLVADHMPMAGAAQELAAAFGFAFTNGFALDTLARGPSFFSLADSTLAENVITKGRDHSERVENVVTFTGQAFRIPDHARPIITFNDQYVNFLPDTAWVFSDQTPRYNLEGWSQGAYTNWGKGRVVVFGEAAMFTAQLAGPDKIRVGMNSADAPRNYQLLLNIIHWLDGKL